MTPIRLAGEPDISIELRASARARRLSLRISQLDGRVTMTMPRSLSRGEAEAFAREKEGWLRKHLSQSVSSVVLGHGSSLPVEGTPRLILQGAGRAVKLSEGHLHVPGPPERAAARVAGFLKVLARDRLSAASDAYALRLGRDYGRISLRDTRSRWGSCSSEGNLMYSWRLIMAPPEVLDYVAAHEVCHLAEMNHSARYWAHVERLCPGYRDHRNWLRRNGAALHRYRFSD